MSDEEPHFYNHFQEGHFTASFTALDQLRKEDILTDISIVAAENDNCTVRAHKLVLMAVSDYFRTMFKSEYISITLQLLHINVKNLDSNFGPILALSSSVII